MSMNEKPDPDFTDGFSAFGPDAVMPEDASKAFRDGWDAAKYGHTLLSVLGYDQDEIGLVHSIVAARHTLTDIG